MTSFTRVPVGPGAELHKLFLHFSLQYNDLRCNFHVSSESTCAGQHTWGQSWLQRSERWSLSIGDDGPPRCTMFARGTLKYCVHREQRRKAAATPAFVRKTLNLNENLMLFKEQKMWRKIVVFKHAPASFLLFLFAIKFEPLVHGLWYWLFEEVQMSDSTVFFLDPPFPLCRVKRVGHTQLTARRLCEGACMCACVFKCAWGHVGHDEWRVCGERPLLDAPEKLRTLPPSPEPPWLQWTRTGKLSFDWRLRHYWDQWGVSHCRK